MWGQSCSNDTGRSQYLEQPKRLHLASPAVVVEYKCAKFGRAEGDLGPVYGHQWRNFSASLKADGTYERRSRTGLLLAPKVEWLSRNLEGQSRKERLPLVVLRLGARHVDHADRHQAGSSYRDQGFPFLVGPYRTNR